MLTLHLLRIWVELLPNQSGEFLIDPLVLETLGKKRPIEGWVSNIKWLD